jgi:hypothetical protein
MTGIINARDNEVEMQEPIVHVDEFNLLKPSGNFTYHQV